ncbi:cancer-related regulator of actin dynamics isoform X3 [Nannospalax galili]|uniref:cancer-related regulator of actin dynamics isoform X3 n=1 Tax=Nannospalax galili TaxID=1026970 RepID=UPI00111C45EB|nr:cancer-related regulator of actin dynamics isoform X3 [Nannospalax galili]
MTVFLSLMGEQKVSRQFKQCHRTTSWAKSKLFSRLSSMFLRQLGKNIKFGQRPPNAIPMKKAGSAEVSSEEDLFLTSPMEVVTQQDIVLSDTENKSSDTPSSPSPLNLPRAGSEMEEKVAPVKPSRPKRHFSSAGTIESVNLDAIPLAIARLDNSAAKHKLAVKPKNQRVSRKHRRLAQDRQNEPGSFEGQFSLDQNGQPGEDKYTCPEEESQPLDSQEDKRLQEEYWQELEAKCKRQKAEAAERRRLEEQRLQALERRLWENCRQELLEEEEEEEEEEKEEEEEEEGGEAQLQLEVGKAPPGEGQQAGVEEPHGRDQAPREPEDPEHLRVEERRRVLEEAERLEELRQCAQEEEARRLLEAQRQQEELEAERKRMEELRQKQEEEEAKRLLEELRQQEEEEAKKLLEELWQQEEEEERKRLEGLRKQEEERRRLEELNRQREQEEDAKRREELKRWEMEALGRQEAEERGKAPQSPEEESQPQTEDDADLRSPLQNDLEEKLEEHESLQPRLQRQSEEELKQPTQQAGERTGKRGGLDEDVVDEGGREAGKIDNPEQQEWQTEETPDGRKEAAAADQDRKVEELRWQEVEERQTMPRPYTFQVSSGGRQILFPKVNLSPVTPAKDAGLVPAAQEPQVPGAGPAPHSLPSALSIPHTAILVTGAQLCGPAVNLSQIKDTACKSLLGLAEEKRPADVRAVEPRASGSKARPHPESPSSAAALAEWASIRSRILKNADGDPRGDRDPARTGDEPATRARCDSRGNLRRTLPVNAKFSIMSARQKFSDSGAETPKQNPEAESIRKKPGPAPGEETAPQPPIAGPPEPRKSPELRREPADTSDGCKFAKDLPSFLVPGLPSPQKGTADTEFTSLDGESGVVKPDLVMPGSEEKASPFGIKLRRTNYSLRFHWDQQVEQKKKKRHSSMGDSVDGGTPAAGSTHGEKKEPEAVTLRHGPSLLQERKQASAPQRDSAESPGSHSVFVAQPGPSPVSSQVPAPEHKAASKMPLMPKPALAPKPTGQTPPSSPLSRLSRPYLVDLPTRRAVKPDPELTSEPSKEGQESSVNQPPSPSPLEDQKRRDEEEEVSEKKPASPTLSASQQERSSLIPETGRKEKPVLQSRHSLDGSKLMEKVETAQPLWITLALQKQKGFREQQATREERKQARDAKQAEKLSRENVSVSPQPGSSHVSRAGSLHKSTAEPAEEKKPETAVSRLQRRDQLKKANTLPTSVTVEISDSAPPAPLVKEVTKRFSTPDAAPVSTEPAWLALAKRKAKAWSDCPQIIK